MKCNRRKHTRFRRESYNDEAAGPETTTLRNRGYDVGRIGTLITAGIQGRNPIVVGLAGLHGVVGIGRSSYRGRGQLGCRPAWLCAAVHVVAYNARACLRPREADKVRLSTGARERDRERRIRCRADHRCAARRTSGNRRRERNSETSCLSCRECHKRR